MSLFHALLTDVGPPPIPAPPPDFDTTVFSPGGFTARANVSTRQAALEPSVAGVDHAFSFSVWVQPHNMDLMTLGQRFFGVGETGVNTAQWVVALVAQSGATFNQCLQFVIFGPAGSTSIQILSSARLWRGRFTHLVGTYDGSESQNGFKLYINGREDTGATKVMGGTYTGAGDSANFRMMLSTVFGTTVGRFAGRMRDLALWDEALSLSEVTELYNNDTPVDVDSVSFYAGKILAYWPLRTGITCLNSSTFNFGSSVGITHAVFPMSSKYPFFGQFNAIPGNTRYLSFGSCYQTANFTWRIYQRSGTDHVTSGKIVKIIVSTSGYTPVVGAPIDVITNAMDIRSAQAGEIEGDVYIFSALYNTGTALVTDIVYWVSTDGAVGETFGSPVSITGLLPFLQGVTFSKIIAGPGVGEFMVPVYGINGATYYIGYLKRDTGGTWSFVQMYSGATAYTETCILNCGAGRFISLSRLNTGGGLFMQSSTDGAVTWSAHTSIGLGSGICMADLSLTLGGKVVLIFADRADGTISVSHTNVVDDILADPTDWNAISNSFLSYTTDSTTVLGYTVGRPWGSFGFVVWSAEFSSSRADLFIGYGQLEY